MKKIILIVHNVRSAHNVGSLLRTADGLGVSNIWLTGYTPFPFFENDTRLPHVSRRVNSQIAKTALGAEKSLKIRHADDIKPVILDLKKLNYLIIALEQHDNSKDLTKFQTTRSVALIVGREVEGIEDEVLKLCDLTLEIPMFGRKESFNVAVAAAMALYRLRFAA